LHSQSECNCIYHKYLVHAEAHIRHYMHLSLIGGIVVAYMHVVEDPITFSSWWAKKNTTTRYKSNGITTKNTSKDYKPKCTWRKMSNFKWLDSLH